MCSCLCGCAPSGTWHWLTMARGTMPARSSCASRISVSTSCVVARLAGYSTCQAIQRLPSGSGKLSIFKSTWSTLWNPISNLPEYKGSQVKMWTTRCVCSCDIIQPTDTTPLMAPMVKTDECVCGCNLYNFTGCQVPLCLVKPLLPKYYSPHSFTPLTPLYKRSAL